jgi:hypothetical protein
MNLESISAKYVGELEQKVHQLLLTMRKANLHSEPLYASLLELEQELEETRRSRFDKDHSDYEGY